MKKQQPNRQYCKKNFMTVLAVMRNHTLSCDLQHVLAKLYSSSSSKDQLERSTALPATCMRNTTLTAYLMSWSGWEMCFCEFSCVLQLQVPSYS